MEMTTNAETGESSSGRSPRFTTWVAFLVFSTVTMGSAVEEKNQQGDPVASNTRWAVFCSAVTFTLTAIVVLMHLHPVTSLFIVGTKVEGGLCIVLVAFWAGTVSIISNADHGLATERPTNTTGSTISNGNLYYFSWAGFVTSVYLCVSYLRSVFGVDVAGEIRNRAARLAVWSGMLASALVVMGSSADIFDSSCNVINDNNHTFCKRTKFAISLGAIGTFFSLAVVAMKLLTATAPFVVEAILALFLVILNAFGVAYITSAKGPGAPIGNLYYFTWISFLSSMMLVAGCFEDYKSAGTATTSANGMENGENNKNVDIQVESLDDNI